MPKSERPVGLFLALPLHKPSARGVLVVTQPQSPRDSFETAVRAEPALGELIADHRRSPALFDDSRTPLALSTFDGILVAANLAASEALGAGGELAGASLFALFARDADVARRSLERVRQGEALTVRDRLRDLRGRVGPSVVIEFTPATFESRPVGAYVSWRAEIAPPTYEVERRLQELGSLFEHSLDAMLALGLDSTVSAVNSAAARMFGYEREELLGRPFGALVESTSLEHATRLFERAASGEAFGETMTGLHRDGHAIAIEGVASPIVVDGDVLGLYVVGRDITERRRLERQIREQTERIHELYLVAASTGRGDDQTRAALELGMRRLGCDGAYLANVKNALATYVHALGSCAPDLDAVRPLVSTIDRAILADGRSFALYDIASEPLAIPGVPAGPGRRGSFIGAPVVLDGTPYGTLGFVRTNPTSEGFEELDRDFVRLIASLAASAIQRSEQRRRLDSLAYFDGLTGLPNRTLLHERIEETISVSRRRGRNFAVHFVDLDGFKYVNDAYGHPHGDSVLRALAQRLSNAVRRSDVVARLGGDEFVVLQPEIASAGEALEVAGRLRDLIAEPVNVGAYEHRLGCSIGIALYPHDGRDVDELLARADAALYRVKNNGRNGVAFASAPPEPREIPEAR
jgi:diguanylate cyclase (GGDEF)-like protein/PAS domain S-box-containing protein